MIKAGIAAKITSKTEGITLSIGAVAPVKVAVLIVLFNSGKNRAKKINSIRLAKNLAPFMLQTTMRMLNLFLTLREWFLAEQLPDNLYFGINAQHRGGPRKHILSQSCRE